jgi:hypothetical protein
MAYFKRMPLASKAGGAWSDARELNAAFNSCRAEAHPDMHAFKSVLAKSASPGKFHCVLKTGLRAVPLKSQQQCRNPS